ncbi:TetR/AcrR family transcriptional regulator [Agrobacterium vitis]|uniref:TetR/AcrR family transcriptional regulator n=1 Tax=Agrobacterium vitis TaxID=373 RepID=A0AAE2RHT8_AGRVI|nr:TetR/AcrR family transcriptional regulator [Agrobacterium vitis]MBF2716906.1 TetR/AcrR family transcriptional regulator [Agrobacterium vitis]MUZ64109.1 TetR family transcriptional regulator [Agrobacterium vitis]MVA19758.1 TetR family transcriptional regulator [Agrobacterium vitis]
MAQRGRPRSFDRTQALDRALMAFWQNGFEATSMHNLVEAMQINSPSIYAAFGSKEALFAETIDYYREAYASELLQALNDAADAASGIEAMFAAAIELFTRLDTPGGCFVVNSVASNAPNGLELAQTMAQLRWQRSEQIAERLREDVRAGKLRDDTPVQELSDLYAVLLQGLAQAARDGLGKTRLMTLCEHSRHLILPWQMN